MSNLIKTARAKACNLMLKASPVAMCASTAATIIIMDNAAFAAGDAKGLLETIIGIICKLIIALGVIMAIMGIINYASAHSEGDGPAQNKAIGKIAAGVMLVSLSVVLDSQKGTLAGYIS